MNEQIYTTPKRIDNTNATGIGKEVEALVAEKPEMLVIEMQDTVYISSVGLRILLSAQKKMNKAGCTMVLRHVSDQVREVFDITGFSGFLNIEADV